MLIFTLAILGLLLALGVCNVFFPAALRYLFELRNRIEGGGPAYQPEDRALQRRAGAMLILCCLAAILFVLSINQ
ncbi:MAG TPA: hypothetical protein VGE07_26795 [Herpetosiphonaceae bacterium]